eukprot:6551341-Pyramimonas_sp.AAC.1
MAQRTMTSHKVSHIIALQGMVMHNTALDCETHACTTLGYDAWHSAVWHNVAPLCLSHHAV